MKIRILLSGIAIFMTIASCNKGNKEIKEAIPEPAFIHTVFFWLNDSVTSDEKAMFESGLKKLGTVPVINKFYYGIPAGTPRDVVDNSYDYAWVVHFSNAADQDAYQADPIHLEFIESYKHLWKRVQVYDTNLIK